MEDIHLLYGVFACSEGGMDIRTFVLEWVGGDV